MTLKAPIAILFANLKGNIGDFAILHAMLKDLSERYPGHALHVFSHGYLKIDEDRLAAFRKGDPPEFELVGTTYFEPVPTALKLLSPLGIWPFVQARLVRSLSTKSLSDAAKFAGYEAIFVAGGDQWSGRRLGISMFATLAAVRAHNNRIFAYPFSVNPRIGRYSSSQSLRQNFGNIRGPLVVRDSISKGVINQLGLPVVSGWDCVYGIQDLAYNIEPQPDRDATRTLLVITGRSPNLERSLRTLLKRLIPEVGPLELLTTCAPVDGKTYERLSAEFDIPSRLPMSWQETVAELKATAIVVTNRLHGLILGSFAEATLLPVTDRKKAEAFVRDAGLPYYACKLSDLSPALIRTAKANEVVILDKLKRYRDQSRKALLGPMFDPSLN